MTAITPIRRDATSWDTSQAFRTGMRQLASGVSIVTSGTGRAPVGLVATAVCSVSIEPPTLLVSISRTASAYPAIDASGRLCVNVLGDGHADLLAAFTTPERRAERFTDPAWRLRPDAPPLLENALAAFDCHVVERFAYATHMVFFARPETVLVGDGDPLLHFDRGFHRLAR
jgi:flavin reductase